MITLRMTLLENYRMKKICEIRIKLFVSIFHDADI